MLVCIAKGLNITLSPRLGAEADRSEISITRARDRVTFRDPESSFEREVLSAAQPESGVEILLHRTPPGQTSGLLPAYCVPTEK